MNEDRQKFAELEELLGALRDGTIADEQIELLDRLLATDAGAREYYLEYMDLCATLGHFQGQLAGARESGEPGDAGGSVVREGPGASSPHGFKLPRSRPSATRRRLLVPALAAAAAVLLGIGLIFYHPPRPDGSTSHDKPDPGKQVVETERDAPDPGKQVEEAEAVAVLTRAVQPEWEGEAPAVGSKFRAGKRLRLRSGIAQLEFFSGAVLVVEGPADFEPRGTDRVYCREGRVRARVSPPAEGFAIDSPAVKLVDRGTEFGFRIDRAGKAEVHVFNGKVELHNAAGGALRAGAPHLMAGNGVSIDPRGNIRKFDADPSAFVSVAKLEEQWRDELRDRHQKWLKHSENLRADSRLLLYYTFQDQQPWERTLLNQALVRKGELNGAIIGCSWSEGRWPGKGALDFKRPDNRVRIHVPGEYKSLTFLAWLRVDSFDQQLSALMLTDGFDVGALHWQLNDKGEAFLGIQGPDAKFHNYYSPVFLGPDKLGEWLQVAAVYDRGSQKVRHYVNGRPVSREDIHFDTDLRLGDVEIGNWGRTIPIVPKPLTIRNFNGRIDEFALFREALSSEEIARLYERGKACP